MSINQKIWTGFGVLIAMALVGSGIGYLKSQKADVESRRLANVNLAEQTAARNALEALQTATIEEQLFLISRESNAIPRFEAAVAEVKRHLGQVMNVSPSLERREAASKTAGTAEAYLASYRKLIALKIHRGLSPADGLEGQLRTAVHDVEQKVQDQGLAELSVIMLMCRRHEKDYLLRGDPKYLEQVQQCIGDFSKQMKQFSLADAMQKDISKLWDHYYDSMKALVEGDQEIKTLLTAFQAQSQTIQDQVSSIQEAASRDLEASNREVLADLLLGKRANLCGVVAGGVVGFLIAFWVAGSLRSLNRTIHGTASTLSLGAEHVVSASGQVARSSQSLAEGASEQAASVEETSASLEELSSMTKRNAENAQKANDLARQTRTAAEKGVVDMQAMSQAMQVIKNSSDDVAKIIRTIDEIAFQTNILALNAAVEAARAGEAGMGFAVVADEVRNLAQRSATAAKETAAKIEGAITNTAQGVLINAKVAEALNEIVTLARQVDELAAEVAGASREQTQGIVQINTAVGQMDKVTQNNAANAEEGAAAAEELNSQTELMKEAVSRLLQIVNGDGQKGTPPPAPSASVHTPRAILPLESARNRNNFAPSAAPTSQPNQNHRRQIPLEGDFKEF